MTNNNLSQRVDELRDKAQSEFTQEGVIEEFGRVYTEQSSRAARKYHPTVITWETDRENDPNDFGFKPPEGSVTLYWATKDSQIIPELEYAHISHDVDKLDDLFSRLIEEYASRSVQSVEEAARELVNAPVFFEFRYSGKQLAPAVWTTDDAEFGSLTFPYNGGELRKEDFTVIEYFENNEPSPHDVLLIVSPPVLTEVEKRALETVPPDMLEMNIGHSQIALPPTTTTLLVVTVFAAINTCICGLPFHDDMRRATLPPRMIETLGTQASAQELLEMRREVFKKYEV